MIPVHGKVGRYLFVSAPIVVLILLFAAGSLLAQAQTAVAVAIPTPPSRSNLFTDPIAFCQTAINADVPDARYAGPPVPDAIALGTLDWTGMPNQPPVSQVPAGYAQYTHWRCMNGKVYACNMGNTDLCSQKADLSRAPSQAMRSFCQANPDNRTIPSDMTGRATVYQWHCSGSTPQIIKQYAQPDARGFVSHFWAEIQP